jgi:hypothetical protein
LRKQQKVFDSLIKALTFAIRLKITAGKEAEKFFERMEAIAQKMKVFW